MYIDYDEIVKEWAWRVPNGKPNLNNPYHKEKLKEVLKELNYPLNLLTKPKEPKKVLSEAATGRTETLHEVFFAVAFACIMKKNTSEYDKIYDFNSFKKILNSVKGFVDVHTKHLKAVKDFHTKDNVFTGKAGTKDLEKLADAMALAHKVYTYIKVNIGKPTSVSRVFGAGPGGQKVIADAVVSVGKQKISISLKYGKAQFNSLSVPQLVKKLYGIDLQDGILKDMYNNGYKGAINEVFYEFIQPIVTSYKNWPLTKKFTQADMDTLDASTLKANMSWDEYLKVPTDVKKAMSHAYNHPENKDARTIHTEMKKVLLNTQIENFMGASAGMNSMGDLLEELDDALIYILRAEPTTTYLYAADGGNKFAMMPSQEHIKGKTYKLQPSFKTVNADMYTEDGKISKWADYKFDVDVYVDNIKAFTFDIIWRFAGAGGQWATDLNHKGGKIVFHSGFSKAFGLPNIPKDEVA